jgi:phosphoribosylanthranilate isomerase
MTRVKICGLRDPETALETAKAGADFIGLIFAESRRQVSPQQCHDIVEALAETRRGQGLATFEGPAPGEVRGASWFGAWNEAIDDAVPRFRPLLVGVFANQPVEQVNDIAAAASLDLVQLAGSESWEFARRVERPVINVLHVREQTTAFDIFDDLTPGSAAAVMLDTGGGAGGGTGVAFDWDVATEVAQRLPFMLAGGLTPENVAAAIAQVDPWAVDVSTGVETDGVKDIEKIRAFIRAAKGVARVQ